MKPAPPLCAAAQEAAQPQELLPTLLPFQRRSVAWLLTKEGKRINDSGAIATSSLSNDVPLFWDKYRISENITWYMNALTDELLPSYPPVDEPMGGILAEEPGLGKTVESIALIMLNPATDRDPSKSHWNEDQKLTVKEIKTTLIVTPTSLAQQWADEIRMHAPTLKVYIYDGWKQVPVPITERKLREEKERRHENRLRRKRKHGDEEVSNEAMDPNDDYGVLDWPAFIHDHDVCITTYDVLQQDLTVAFAPMKRPRREVAVDNYRDDDRPRSPLLLVEWNRVIMDEVQMVGGRKTEYMVSLIPRISSFAVSGTPARNTVDDLIHVLKFLRYDTLIGTQKYWKKLQQPAYASHFKALFERIGIRTTKDAVQTELTIPVQSRYVVPIALGPVERHVYDQNLEEALQALHVDARGVAAEEGWQVDVAVLRTWMRRLRGICTHPQVGQLARQADKFAKSGGHSNLKTITEVFELMRDQGWRDLMDDRKLRIQNLVRKAQLTQRNEANQQRHKLALETLQIALVEVQEICKDVTTAITEHDARGEVLKEEAARRRQAVASGEQPLTGTSLDKGKGKQRAESVAATEDSTDDGLPKTPAGEEHRRKKLGLQIRLREYLLLAHQVNFLLGDVYHVLGQKYEEAENSSYAEAENLRKRILKSAEDTATLSMAILRQNASKKTVTKKDLILAHCGKGGIRSEDLLREADEIIDTVNEQAKLLLEWRERISHLLTQSLTSGEGEADGQEYARSLDTQGEVETYLQAYSALLADRREVMLAERTALAAHDVSENKLRHTKAAQKASAARDDEQEMLQQVEDIDLQPEDEVLRAELTMKRKELHAAYGGRAIKSVMVDLSRVANSIASEPEKTICREWSSKLRRIISEQGNLHDKLDTDMVQFRKTFNDRIQYFRQLQEISDSVADVEWIGPLENVLVETAEEEARLVSDINKSRARQRYLDNLVSTKKGTNEEDEDEKSCILCKCEFTKGFITHCAHVFCEECLKAWFARREGKSCPVCRVVINPDQVQRVFMHDKKIDVPESLPRNAETIPQSKRVIDYNAIDSQIFDDIQRVESVGNYGSKIQSIVRHLLYLQETEPGAKSIVFSAWADSLFILEHALTANGITCLRIDQRVKKGKEHAAKKFRTDPGILVLLLHGERENAGLNVTCASRVFLVESVVQHSFEIQAIARIDRMGQTRPTEVYCYYAENTVEKNILDLAAKKGLSLYTKDRAIGTLRVTSFDLDQEQKVDAPATKGKQKGDFIMKADDMLAILFPHLYEDVEFLLPGGDVDVDMPDVEDDFIDSQPVAGPSRLR
ncbi:hypothetical protein SCHPADRAFT_823117 [Schizopora paradoxa]|uniref:RING-type domain-containing protein n=1 Tax=Schizopora paradoxa TaxID=27342 RepID=A0A0H2SHJ3_9AGAM|nr:hypothetical protein SCHPADRAFT_823117 [Schizopora paradoxa]